MLREEDIVTALIAYRQGRDGFVIDPETMEVKTFYEVFRDLIKNRYMIDWKESEKEEEAPAEDPAEDPEEEPAAEPPKEKKRGGRPETGKAEQIILKAWGGGEHSISEIMRMTGYSYQTVRRYIPISPKG